MIGNGETSARLSIRVQRDAWILYMQKAVKSVGDSCKEFRKVTKEFELYRINDGI